MTRWLAVRAALDRVVAGALLLIASPVIALLGWRIRRHDGGPALVGLTRLGRRGVPFTIWKLRSMRADGEGGRARGAPLSGWSDARVTPLGAQLRQWRLDELPQLWNVVRGEMALLGPRPETPEFVDLDDDRWRAVLAARPGIAGPSQVVAHRFEAAVVDAADGEARYRREILPAKLAVDRWYLGAASPRLDVFIIASIAHRFVFRRPGGGLERQVAGAVPEFATLRDAMEAEFRSRSERSPDDERRRLAAAYGHDALHARRQRRWHAPSRGNTAIIDERRRAFARLLDNGGLAGMGVVELGCGRGDGMEMLVDLGAGPCGLVGIDALPDRLRQASARNRASLFVRADGRFLSVGTGAVDVVSVLTTFSSIGTVEDRVSVAAEIDRVLRPRGRVLWYDLRVANPANRDVRPLRLRHVRALFPGYRVRARSITVVPPVARRLGRFVPAVYPVLATVPVLRTHLVAVLTKPDDNDGSDQTGWSAVGSDRGTHAWAR